jgi:hypothetical protein
VFTSGPRHVKVEEHALGIFSFSDGDRQHVRVAENTLGIFSFSCGDSAKLPLNPLNIP